MRLVIYPQLFLLFYFFGATTVRSFASKKKLVIDKEHLKFDFLNIFGSWADIFSDAEMDFRYFAAHDYDGNKKLDGLEMLTALGHDASHEGEPNAENHHSSPEEIEKQVDDIFRDHDLDNDGFLEYKEFLTVQRTYPDINAEKKSKDRKTTTQEL